MKVLYIPFAFDDALYDLHFKGVKWQEEYALKNKEVVIIYHGSSSKLKKERIQQALQLGTCQIYVLSHGVNSDKLIVANQTKMNDDYKELTIEEVAQRFHDDFLALPFHPANVVKLYFCDVSRRDNKARMMAVNFREKLGSSYKDIDVKYYTDVSITLPSTQINVDMLFATKKAVRQFQAMNELLCFNLFVNLGNPKLFRHGLNEPESTMRFYDTINQEKKVKAVKYPNYTHTILKEFAKTLVEIINSDQVLSRYQESIIQDLFTILPLDLKDYFVNSLTLLGTKVYLDIRINKEILKQHLIQTGAMNIHVDNPEVNRNPQDNESWIDPEDFMEHTTFLENQLDFLSLDDYAEVLHNENGEPRISIK